MGGTVNARCSCGFQAENLPIGGGRTNFTTYCAFPVLCRACKRFGTANLLEGKGPRAGGSRWRILDWFRWRDVAATAAPHCGFCDSAQIIPYDFPELVAKQGQRVETWNMQKQLGRELLLTDGQYYCPQCEKFELTFERNPIRWD